jgi:hypothetical protein
MTGNTWTGTGAGACGRLDTTTSAIAPTISRPQTAAAAYQGVVAEDTTVPAGCDISATTTVPPGLNQIGTRVCRTLPRTCVIGSAARDLERRVAQVGRARPNDRRVVRVQDPAERRGRCARRRSVPQR